VFLFAPLLYVAAMLLYMGSLPLDVVPRIITRSAPGSVYRSPQLYARLRADMDADNSTDAVSFFSSAAAFWISGLRCVFGRFGGLLLLPLRTVRLTCVFTFSRMRY
jgi:hypothetical protein